MVSELRPAFHIRKGRAHYLSKKGGAVGRQRAVRDLQGCTPQSAMPWCFLLLFPSFALIVDLEIFPEGMSGMGVVSFLGQTLVGLIPQMKVFGDWE